MPGYGKEYTGKKRPSTKHRFRGLLEEFTVSNPRKVVQGTSEQAVNRTNKRDFNPKETVVKKNRPYDIDEKIKIRRRTRGSA